MKAEDLLKKDILTVSPEDNIVDVGAKMLAEKVSGAAVLEDNNIVGIVSKETFVLGLAHIREKPLAEFKVADLMETKYRSVDISAPIDDIVKIMLEIPYRIDRLVVTDNGKFAGIITKARIVELFIKEIERKFKVKDLMKYKPSMVYDYTPLTEVLKELDRSSGKRVLVCSAEKVIGIVTVLDISKEIFKRLKDGKDYSDLKVIDIMTKDPRCVKPNDYAKDAALIMIDEHIGGLPVVDKKLEGIITKADIIKGYDIVLKGI